MLAAALAGTGLRGRTWVLWGCREGSLRRDVGASCGEDVVRVDGNDPMVYVGVKICDKASPVDTATGCAAHVVTCSEGGGDMRKFFVSKLGGGTALGVLAE